VTSGSTASRRKKPSGISNAKLETMMGVSHDDTQESWIAMMEEIPMIGFTPDRG